MNIITPKLMIIGLLFAGTLVSGVLLSNAGKPLNTLIFTVHKLTAVGAVILLAASIYNLSRTVEVHGLAVGMIMLSALLFLALIISGALLSFTLPARQITMRVHQIAPLLALASSAISVYLLAGSETLSRIVAAK